MQDKILVLIPIKHDCKLVTFAHGLEKTTSTDMLNWNQSRATQLNSSRSIGTKQEQTKSAHHYYTLSAKCCNVFDIVQLLMNTSCKGVSTVQNYNSRNEIQFQHMHLNPIQSQANNSRYILCLKQRMYRENTRKLL